MDGLMVGTTVDIRRTDGRIHEAVISSLNTNNRSATVEWLEKVGPSGHSDEFPMNVQGETKGKEIDIASLLSVNPALARDLAQTTSTIQDTKQNARQNNKNGW
jgi:kinesin family protein 2/24